MGTGDHVTPESSGEAENFHNLCPHSNTYTPASFRERFSYCFAFRCSYKHKFSGSSKLFFLDLVCQKDSCVEAQGACVMGGNKSGGRHLCQQILDMVKLSCAHKCKFSFMGTRALVQALFADKWNWSNATILFKFESVCYMKPPKVKITNDSLRIIFFTFLLIQKTSLHWASPFPALYLIVKVNN